MPIGCRPEETRMADHRQRDGAFSMQVSCRLNSSCTNTSKRRSVLRRAWKFTKIKFRVCRLICCLERESLMIVIHRVCVFVPRMSGVFLEQSTPTFSDQTRRASLTLLTAQQSTLTADRLFSLTRVHNKRVPHHHHHLLSTADLIWVLMRAS